MVAAPAASAGERYLWLAGVVFVAAVVAESALSFGIPLNQNDSATKIARGLHDHRKRILVIASICVVYAAAFPVYLSRLHDLLRRRGDRARSLFLLFVLVSSVVGLSRDRANAVPA